MQKRTAMATRWKNRELLRYNFISRPLSQQRPLFWAVVVFALLLSLVATVTLWPFYSPAQEMVGKDMDDEIGKYQDWNLPASHPKMVQLADRSSQQNSRSSPLKYLPEYRNPCWHFSSPPSVRSGSVMYIIHSLSLYPD